MITGPEAYDFFEELLEINKNEEIPIHLKYAQLRTLLEKISTEVVKNETVAYGKLFQKLTFICKEYGANRKIHGLRVTANNTLHQDYRPTEEEYIKHFRSLSDFISEVSGFRAPAEFVDQYPQKGQLISQSETEEFETEVEESDDSTPEIVTTKEEKTQKTVRDILTSERISKLRVAVVEVEEDYLICESEFAVSEEDEFLKVKINEPEINDLFSSIDRVWLGAQLNLLNIQLDENGILYPKIIILEPDYLLNITSIASCFRDYANSELEYIFKKFSSVPNNKAIRLGGFANLVVDELFALKKGETLTFNDVFLKDFKQNPFEYTACTDLLDNRNFKDYMQEANRQFLKIENVVHTLFPENDISLETAALEPSFLCETCGVQGRLDILDNAEGKRAKIIELKSGKTPFRDNGTQIKLEHEAQLFLYFQMISVINNLDFHEIVEKTDGYILYSKADRGNLRDGTPYLSRIQEIFEMRNRLVLNEHLLAENNFENSLKLLLKINPQNIIKEDIHPKFRAAVEPQYREFAEALIQAEELDRDYFVEYVNFIAKEQYQSKVGSADYEGNNGLADLWLSSFEEKKERYQILYDLVIVENKVDQEEQTIKFKRAAEEESFVNFREGDICILYPRETAEDIPTSNQVFKCTILSLSNEEVVLHFRYKQRNTNFFKTHKKYALERDALDSSFKSMYQNHYIFFRAAADKRKLIYTTRPPVNNDSPTKIHWKVLSQEQNRILNKAVAAKDYFILNGPPGTGKTSFIIKHLIEYFHREGDKNILLLAYTNRAVDELCSAIKEALKNSDEKEKFIRIGGELSCAKKHRPYLLDNIIEFEEERLRLKGENLNRKSIKKVLKNHRIFVSTVASISSRADLLDLKEFDVAIVDEASQILEPQINGILTKISKFILVGDHHQLPAIVLQDSESSKTNRKSLHRIGLRNRRNSLFERLYKYCKKNDLDYAYDRLTYQGRMHQEIALFPSFNFYDSELKPVCNLPNLSENVRQQMNRQKNKLAFKSRVSGGVSELLATKRLIFFNSSSERKEELFKSNSLEADLVTKIVLAVRELYVDNNREWDEEKTIGIIAPFRNQIALIKKKLELAGIPNYDKITIDTVERFQGSQRDIIIMSFSINNPYQLKSLVNLNDEGTVDRKLNVALTRAREQLILIGNDSFLSENLIYFKLIEFIKSRGGFIWNSIEDVLNDKYKFSCESEEEFDSEKIFETGAQFRTAMNNLVFDHIRNDSRTKGYLLKNEHHSWQEYPFGKHKEYILNNILEYGRADFDQNNLLDTEFNLTDKVNLYCHFNMEKNYLASSSLFESFEELFLREIEHSSGRVTFIDFGCGPMTAGIAFNDFYSPKFLNLNFKYVGIDNSTALLKKAKEFSESELFKRGTHIQLQNSINLIETKILEEWFELANTVVFNFSYFFSKLNVEQTRKLAFDIDALIKKYPFNKYYAVYQNSSGHHLRFNKFKQLTSKLTETINRNNRTIVFKNNEIKELEKLKYAYEVLTISN